MRVFRGGGFHAQHVFNCAALPKFNTEPNNSTAAPRTDRALSSPCVTSSVAVDGELNTSMSTKFRHCSVFWTHANCIAESFNGVRKCAHLCGLTFELSGRQRQDARPGLAKMYRVPPDRAWWPAVDAPLERGVRRRRAHGPLALLCVLPHQVHARPTYSGWCHSARRL